MKINPIQIHNYNNNQMQTTKSSKKRGLTSNYQNMELSNHFKNYFFNISFSGVSSSIIGHQKEKNEIQNSIIKPVTKKHVYRDAKITLLLPQLLLTDMPIKFG